jgi:hypothetical protein
MKPNIKLLIISAALVIIAGLANGIMDTLQFHYSQSIFPYNSEFWNPDLSWKNKWKQIDGELVQPLTPRFFGSSTFLVWTTDAWHLFQTIMFAAFRTAIVLALASVWRIAKGWYNVLAWTGIWILFQIIQSVGFHIMYSWWLV